MFHLGHDNDWHLLAFLFVSDIISCTMLYLLSFSFQDTDLVRSGNNIMMEKRELVLLVIVGVAVLAGNIVNVVLGLQKVSWSAANPVSTLSKTIISEIPPVSVSLPFS